MAIKIAVYFLVLIFALPLIAMAMKATFAILASLLSLALLVFVLWVVWTVFSAVWQSLSNK